MFVIVMVVSFLRGEWMVAENLISKFSVVNLCPGMAKNNNYKLEDLPLHGGRNDPRKC